jgi:hypothetical protein
MTRNPYAKALASRLYRVRVVKSKKLYQRQPRTQRATLRDIPKVERSTHGKARSERYEAR